MTPTRTRPARRFHPWLIAGALLGSFAVGGCAAFNKGELVLARNVTFGQELIDLKRAKDEGAITEDEFQTIKARIMEMVGEVEVVRVVDDYVPDQVSKPDED